MTTISRTNFKGHMIEEYVIKKEPFYVPVGNEIEMFSIWFVMKNELEDE